MVDESQVVADYKRTESIPKTAQLNGIPNYRVAEILNRHGYPVEIKPRAEKPRAPKAPDKREVAMEIARERMIEKAAKRAEENAAIKVMLERGLPQTEIAARMNLSASAVFYRKMEIYEPEKYQEHKRKCYEYQKEKAAK